MIKKITLWVFISLITICIAAQNQTSNIGNLSIDKTTIVSVLGNLENVQNGLLNNNGDLYLYENLENNGIIEFNLNNIDTSNAIVRFIGSNTQTIRGDGLFFLNNILFDNENNFDLDTDIRVSTLANFTSGIVNNNSFDGRLIFEDNAEHINVSDASFVNGVVNKIGNDDFIFPIGKQNYYRYAKMSQIENVSNEFDLEYIIGVTDINFPVANVSGQLSSINNSEYWLSNHIETSLESSVLITLTWSQDTTPIEFLNNLQDMHVVGWDAVNNIWTDLGGVVDLVNNEITTTTKHNLFTAYTLGMTDENIALPCGLTVNNRLITPNGDNINDFLELEYSTNSNCIRNINVEIFNRWGSRVFKANNYGLNNVVFDGFSQNKLTVSKNKERLPVGTYFYILNVEYNDLNGATQIFKQANYLYINSN